MARLDVGCVVANGSSLGDGIVALGMKHNHFLTSEAVNKHAGFLGLRLGGIVYYNMFPL